MTRVKAVRVASQLALVREAIGHRIRRERVRLGLTQEQLAERLNLSPNYLAHLERGTRGASMRTLILLSAGLGIPIHALFEPPPGRARSSDQRGGAPAL